MRARCLFVLGLLAGAANAQEQDAQQAQAQPTLPVIRSIEFQGNDVTRPEVMRREMVIEAGDPADPLRIERSRQGIQDLGLFKSVTVDTQEVDGGVALTFVVEEKWYIIPIPRVDANSEGEDAYGLSLRWFNVLGLNHTLRGNWTRRDEEKINKGEQESFSVSYSMPFVFESPYGVSLSAGQTDTPITDFGGYTEMTETYQVSLSRSFARGPASQGWSGSVMLGYSQHDTDGPTAPPPHGEATSLGLQANFRDIRYNIYSEEGGYYGVAFNGASAAIGSDYAFTALSANWGRYNVVGERPHQNLNFFARLGTFHGGAIHYTSSQGQYALGGASYMRGYPGDFVTGDFFYYAAAEYLRPVYWDWLRPVVIVEVGNAFEDVWNSNGRVHASFGLGVRLRVTFLVNVEMELGVALPTDGRGTRFFASKI